MQLILWRHASASHYTGYDRALDPVGHKQAEQGGQWLAAHYPATPVYTSSALRAQETAAHYPQPAQGSARSIPANLPMPSSISCWTRAKNG